MAIRGGILSIVLFAILLGGCDRLLNHNHNVAENDTLLARVGDREMYFSEIEDMISVGSKADSTNQVDAFIMSWLKRNVVLNEAERNFPGNVDINKLVDNYRSSLLLENYKQELVKNALDTSISTSQETDYYELNKDQYLLSSQICRGRIAVIPDDAPRLERFFRNWKKNDTTAIDKYLDKNASQNINDQKRWYSTNQFLSILPEGLFKEGEIKKGNLQKHKDSLEYFVKVEEVLKKNEIPPLSYIRENIRKVIIHKRKKAILDNIEQKLYEDYLNANKIKLFSEDH